MADLPSLLLASLNPDTRRQAESELNNVSTQPGFLTHLLQFVLEPTADRAVRLAGSIYLKNIAKLRWEEDIQPLSEADKTSLRASLVPAMLSLSNQANKSIRAQIAESISLIAALDFPSKWPDLITQLVSSLSPTDYGVNISLLETSHSIFRYYRSETRSDKLFSEINIVLAAFMSPFLQLYRQVAAQLLSNAASVDQGTYSQIAQCAVLLNQIFYDLTCQDLPPAIEDANDDFFGPASGLFHAYLKWDPPHLRVGSDETTPSIPSQVKTAILEVVELFIKLYPEQFQQSQAVETFVQEIWALIGSNQLPGVSDDALVSQSLQFLSSAVKTGYYKTLFSSRDTISSLVQGVVVPNAALREHDIEQFEDDPLEYVRLDLSLSAAGTDAATRRQSAADVLQALVSSGYEAETTEIVGTWINTGLQDYEANKAENWKSKNSAVYLLIAVATRGSTSQHGVTSTNTLIDVVKFFSDHVFQDLQAESNSVHPILQVDAIRYLYTFRNQLKKAELLSVLPLLGRHLRSSNYVTYTYAAIAIDKILVIKQDNKMIFNQADIRDQAEDILDALLSRIESAGTPEKVAENDHLMRCVMRVIIVARQSLTPTYERLLVRLVSVLGVISKNPSNPNFDQYIYESISALMKFIVAGNSQTLSTFEQNLFGPFTFIIQQDIEQYIPYVFQILAQMLSLHSASVPDQYRPLLSLLFNPNTWLQKGSIPGLVKLLKAFLARDHQAMLANGQVVNVLAVVQQRLIPSKRNDVWGFELLKGVVLNIKSTDLTQYFRPLIIVLLTRMQTSKTDQYAYLLSHFLLLCLALSGSPSHPEMTTDFLTGTVEEVQPALWTQILASVVLPQVSLFLPRDRKLAVVGLTRLLCNSNLMLQQPAVEVWPKAFATITKLFREPQHLASRSPTEDGVEGLTAIDYEEQTAGYQAAYSKLAATEESEEDPVAYVTDPLIFVGDGLRDLTGRIGNDKVRQLIGGVSGEDTAAVGGFVNDLVTRGYNL